MEAVVSSLEDVATVREAVEEGCRHLGIAEDGGPFAEAQVGGDDDAGALVEFVQQMEQQCATRGTERQVAQFIKDNQVEPSGALGDLPDLALVLFLFRRVDQFDGGEEVDSATVMFDGMNAESRCDMDLAGAWPADPDHVLGAIHELAAVQGPDGGLVDLAGCKVETGQVLVGRDPIAEGRVRPLDVVCADQASHGHTGMVDIEERGLVEMA